MWLEVEDWTCHIILSSVIGSKRFIKNVNYILMYSCKGAFLVFIDYTTVNKWSCGWMMSRLHWDKWSLRKYLKSTSFFVVWPDHRPQPVLEFLHTDVINWSSWGAHLRLGLMSGLGVSAMESAKQITPWPISQLHVRYQPLGREALDSGPVLPARCRAADDKVSLHNDVTYL